MKHYKLLAWPDLPGAFHGVAYRRMLHQMSQRYMTLPQLVQDSGLGRGDVLQFLDTLAERQVLRQREEGQPDSRFGDLAPIRWLRRTFSGERPH